MRRMLIPAIIMVWFFFGIVVGWGLHDRQKVEPTKPTLDAKMLQLNDYMKNDIVRGAWRSVYCSKETELILSSPIKQEDLK